MNLMLRTAAMMAATAVDKMLILNFAQNVYANSRKHVQLDILDHWWVMVIAMTNSTIQTASMMGWTAVGLMLIQKTVLSVLVTVSAILDQVAFLNQL